MITQAQSHQNLRCLIHRVSPTHQHYRDGYIVGDLARGPFEAPLLFVVVVVAVDVMVTSAAAVAAAGVVMTGTVTVTPSVTAVVRAGSGSRS